MQKILFTIEGMLANIELLFIALPLVLLGIAVAFLAGLRNRLLLVASGTPVGVGAVAVSAQVLGSLRIAAPLPLCMAFALIVAAGFGALWPRISRRFGPTPPPSANEPSPSEASWPVWAGAVAGAMLGAAAWLPAISRVGGPAQNIDDIWHGYLAARIGDLDFVTAGAMSPVLVDRADPTTFYPYGVHLAAAAIRSVTGVSVPIALNSMWAVGVGLMLPFGIAAFVHSLLPRRPWAAAYAAVFVSALQFFPYALAGIQPYTAGLALIPAVAALLLTVVRARGAAAVFALVLAAAGLLHTHPAAGAAFAVIGALVVIEVIGWEPRLLRPAAARLAAAAGATLLLCWPFLRSEADNRVSLVMTVHAEIPRVWVALKQIAVFQTPWTTKASLLSVFVLLGLAGCLLRRFRGWSLAAAYLVFAALYVGVVTGQSWPQPFVSAWYGEWWRIVGVAVLAASSLAGLGLDTLQSWLISLVGRARRADGRYLLAAGTALGAVVALGTSVLILRSVLSAQATVSGTWSPQRVTPDDIALYRQLRPLLGPGETVLNSWEDGSGAMYAVAGARPLSPYAFSGDEGLQTVVANLGALRPEDCSWLVERKVAFAVANHQTLGGSPNPLLPPLTANTTAFKAVITGPTGTAFRVDPDNLKRCAAGQAS